MNLVDRSFEFLARRSDILQQFDFTIEMDDESLVFVFAQDVIDKGATGGEFLIEDAALAHAGVDEEAESKRKIRFLGEIGDGLGLTVLLESEIILGKIADDAAVLVADGGEEIYGIDVNSDWGGLLAA